MNLNYAYNNRYLMDFNLRADGTSVFGSNKLFSTTWSVGLAWNVHNEEFVKQLGWVNNLKIRGSIGNPGNENFDAYISQKDVCIQRGTAKYVRGQRVDREIRE